MPHLTLPPDLNFVTDRENRWIPDRPWIIDAFSAAGGAGAGWFRAGFNVLGIDNRPQPRYPFPFLLGDVFDLVPRLLAGTVPRQPDRLNPMPFWGPFVAVTGSPTCNDHSYLAHTYGQRHGSAWQVQAFRELCLDSGLPYVIENVPGAPLWDPVELCGTQFDHLAIPTVVCADGQRRRLRRHRLFEASFRLAPRRACDHRLPAVGVHGGGPKVRAPRAIEGRAGYQGTAEERRAAMDTPWMTRDETSLALPPAYTEHVGRYLRAALYPAATTEES